MRCTSWKVILNYQLKFWLSELPDPIDHATGLEKKELLAALAGNDDPYYNKAIKRGAGTKDKPTLIPSAFDARILGCICELMDAIFWSMQMAVIDFNNKNFPF